MIEIKWLTAFLDMPAADFDAGTAFWLAATGSSLSPLRGPDQEFATLMPADGDPYLRVQRIRDGNPAVHLDLHVASVPDARAEAERLGALFAGGDADVGFAPMRSPGGMRFCFVDEHGESRMSQPMASPVPNAVDQVCIDVPSESFEAEVGFWSSITNWDWSRSRLGEFRPLVRQANMPIRLLLQRLGEEGGSATAHLDLSCGAEVAAVVQAHNALGAETIQVRERWTVMRDPAGQIYCLTSRDPVSGLPPT